ncbi:MAG: MerR family DNA-binding transcriptional regulator [Chloroflexi bacterium]|nr:MerR family DNA-binding transcriptional regulator [Chloroflexota bacterium]
MDQNRLTIGKLAKRAGIPPRTLRHYEEAGLLPPPERSEGGYRLNTCPPVTLKPSPCHPGLEQRLPEPGLLSP